MFGTDRDSLRRYYCTVWDKACAGQPLEPLERIIAEAIRAHPEYQPALADAETALGREYAPELGQTNPFLHMGLHLAIREQVATDRPAGIAVVHRSLTARLGDVHDAEHAMIERLGEALWNAQRAGLPPDEARYLESLRRLL